MLQYRTIEPGTLAILKSLMQLTELQDFYLAGGTALALYYGHRLSIDLDLFATVDFQTDSILPPLERTFQEFTYSNVNNKVGLFAFIDNVKVDFVRHQNFKFIYPPLKEEGIRLMSIQDIVAMKISAVLRRAVKKDFWDVSELLKHYTIEEFIDFYDLKYPNQQLLISIPQALTYFQDAEESEDPVSLNGETWEGVKEHILQKVNDYLR